MHIVVLGTQPEYLSGLRGPMIREFLRLGHKVTAIGAEEAPAVRTQLKEWGAEYEVVPLRRAGLNPLKDLGAIWRLFTNLRRLKPDLLFAYTVKPIAYGLPVAWAAGVNRRFAMIAGRGFAFLPGQEPRRRLARFLATWTYRLALNFADGVLFQNEDDWSLFREEKLIPSRTRATRIFGSGIDLSHHRPAPLPSAPVKFLMISRLIADKGIEEYVTAAGVVKAAHPEVIFRLVGPEDPSPNGIAPARIADWRRQGIVEFPGPVSDVRPELKECHVYVLPSYGEGLPRSVLEAMATGRPVVTTDVPGCRDTVRQGVSGYVVPPRDSRSLADAMLGFVVNPASIATMGAEGLKLAREQFDAAKVNGAIVAFIGLKSVSQPEAPRPDVQPESALGTASAQDQPE